MSVRQEMQLDVACSLLGAEDGDTIRQIRAKYHRALRLCHPDAANLEETKALEMTKQINAAYNVIIREFQEKGWDQVRIKKKTEQTSPAWKASVNPSAFCERTIYRTNVSLGGMEWRDPDGEMDADSLRPYPVTAGKYLWDPDEESFAMFLYSLHQKCRALSGKEDINPMLLHFLALEFIRPWECLRKIAGDYAKIRTDPPLSRNPAAFYLEGRIHPDAMGRKAIKACSASPLPFSLRIRNERLHLFLADTDLGHISFEEDPLYFITLMILRSGNGRSEVRLRNTSGISSSLRAEICIRRDASFQEDRPENHSLEIADLL